MGSLPLQLPPTNAARAEAEFQFNILTQYLAGSETAAKNITASINGPATPKNSLCDDKLESAIADLWNLILSTAIQIPYDHPWQDRLVALVDEIKALPPPSRPDLQGLLDNTDPLIGLWGNTMLLDEVIDDKFVEKGLALRIHSSEPDPFSPKEWTNFCAFVARLSVMGVIDKFSDAVKLLHPVLEDPEGSVRALDDNLAAAAVWMLYGGSEIHYRSVQSMEPFSVERWHGWKGHFQALKNDQRLHPSSRDWAEGAWERMSWIEVRHFEGQHDSATGGLSVASV